MQLPFSFLHIQCCCTASFLYIRVCSTVYTFISWHCYCGSWARKTTSSLLSTDEHLLQDYTHAVTVVIPFHVGERCSRWLEKIRMTDRKNKSRYLIGHTRESRILARMPHSLDPFLSQKINVRFRDMPCNSNAILKQSLSAESL